MDRRAELGAFLQAKRAALPLPADGPAYGSTRRRVPGLRREEVAGRALISTTYYTKLERGRVQGISAAVLDGLVTALALAPDERAYVTTLIPVTGEGIPKAQASRGPDAVGSILQRVLDGLVSIPAHVQNERCDIIGTNALGRALYPFHFEGHCPNSVRFLFLDPRARTFFVDWEPWAAQGVHYLRSASARDPGDARLQAMIDDLCAESAEFKLARESHAVQSSPVGTRRLLHPEVGQLDLDFQNLQVTGQPGLRVIAYTADPGSPTAARLARLGAPAPG